MVDTTELSRLFRNIDEEAMRIFRSCEQAMRVYNQACDALRGQIAMQQKTWTFPSQQADDASRMMLGVGEIFYKLLKKTKSSRRAARRAHRRKMKRG